MPSTLIAVVGESGTGKSTSFYPNPEAGMEGLPPKETIVIPVAGQGKEVLYPGVERDYKAGKLKDGANMIFQDNPFTVVEIIEAIGGARRKVGDDVLPMDKYRHIKYIVIDDAGYFQSFLFMDKVLEKGYDKFSEIGQAGYIPIEAAKNVLRDDLIIIFTYHLEETGRGKTKIKTAGKVIDNIIAIEGLFSFVFFTEVEFNPVSKKGKYWFQTQTNGSSSAKSPLGCFKDFQIPNDMMKIVKRIKDYKKGIKEVSAPTPEATPKK